MLFVGLFFNSIQYLLKLELIVLAWLESCMKLKMLPKLQGQNVNRKQNKLKLPPVVESLKLCFLYTP